MRIIWAWVGWLAIAGMAACAENSSPAADSFPPSSAANPAIARNAGSSIQPPSFSAHWIQGGEAEDGRGGTAPGPQLLALDLDAKQFPARALDPVLRLGDFQLKHYQYVSGKILRFTWSPPRTASGPMAVWVQYGGAPGPRIRLVDGWTLPAGGNL